jgi:MerR family transcriptional regulator, light-induced transcriptional regulator
MTNFDRQARTQNAQDGQTHGRDVQNDTIDTKTASPWATDPKSDILDTGKSTTSGRSLGSVIEADVIPRLLMAHQPANQKVLETTTAAQDWALASNIDGDISANVEKLASLAVNGTLSAARAHADRLLAEGMSIEDLLSDVLAPTANYLGWQWEVDRRSFVEVTFGLSRLQQMLRIYGPALEISDLPYGSERSMLLMSMPGAQHTFGLSVVEEYFRSAGWDVRMETPQSNGEVISLVGSTWVDVIGISVATEASLVLLQSLSPMIRAASANRNIRLVVGGAAVASHVARDFALAADAVVMNGKDSLKHLRAILDDLLEMTRLEQG